MSFKTAVNWLFNDIWCYLVIGCLDWKIGVFQKSVVRIYYILNLISLIKPFFVYDQNSQTKKTWLSWEQKEVLRWNKKPFSSLLKGYHWSKKVFSERWGSGFKYIHYITPLENKLSNVYIPKNESIL